MRALGAVLTVVCIGVALAGVHPTQAQEAASANLPDQFQTGEMIQIQKPKKKKAESRSQSLATSAKQNAAPVPEQTPTAEEVPTHMAPPEEKNAEPNRSTTSVVPTQKPETPTKQAPPAEEAAGAAEPAEKKPRAKRRSRPSVQPEAASIAAPVPMSLSVAQSMAISAPLPGYSYEAKRRNLTGNGVCVMIVDSATGTVTNATMYQSTGNAILDNLTIQTFRSWRFKPGTVSQVRVPISYE